MDPDEQARHVQTAPTEAKFGEETDKSPPAAECFIAARSWRCSKVIGVFAMLVVVGMQYPVAGFPAIGSSVLGRCEKGKLCHGPDLLNKGSLSRCRTPGL